MPQKYHHASKLYTPQEKQLKILDFPQIVKVYEKEQIFMISLEKWKFFNFLYVGYTDQAFFFTG